jgi:uncharacterized RDD family membrane protein YckC
MTAAGTLAIRTPEGVEFSLPLAGPFSRMAAIFIDLAILISAGTLLERVMAPLNLISQDAAGAVYTVLYFVLSMLYGMTCEWFWRGQTVGKRILGLRVVDSRGLRLEASQIIVRNVLRLVDMLPAFYLVGGFICVLSERRQRLGDLVAGTVVIRAPKLLDPDLSQVAGSRHNSLAAERHLAARLRQKVSPETASIALEALMRRETLDPASRLRVFRELAQYFRPLAEYPPEVVEQLSDEQYIRDVVEILYSSSRR